MPSQASSTPRTTRNSRGLRAGPYPAPSLSPSSRLSTAGPVPVPSTPTPRSRRSSRPRASTPSGRPTRAGASSSCLGLKAVEEEPAASPAAPITPSPPSSPSSPASSLRHKPVYPRTPSKPRANFRRRYVYAEPSIPPKPRSPGDETHRFTSRRDEEGEDKFARELWIAIRNDHYMRGCWCGSPKIYNSKEEAEAGAGHLRFYIAGNEKKKNLRVLQKKYDFIWHCMCSAGKEYLPAYKALLNSNGKRPAEDDEFELLAQNEDSGDKTKTIKRVVTKIPDATTDDDSTPEDEEKPAVPEQATDTPAQGFWDQARSLFNRAIESMTTPITSLFNKIRKHISISLMDYDTLDIRSKDAANNIVVKRVRRVQPLINVNKEQLPGREIEDDLYAFEDLEWAESATSAIGFDQLRQIVITFTSQKSSLERGMIAMGESIEDIKANAPSECDKTASVCLHAWIEQEHGSLADLPFAEREEKFKNYLDDYHGQLGKTIEFIKQIYDSNLLAALRAKHPKPIYPLKLGHVFFRDGARDVAEFLCFFCSLEALFDIPAFMMEALYKMVVDANAIHKQELPPSFIKLRREPTADMPGYFPDDKASPLEEIPAHQCNVVSRYDYLHPSQEAIESRADPDERKLVRKPKGILKPSKQWPTPASPAKYVPTPQKPRKLVFLNPVSTFAPPKNIPTRVMRPHDEEEINYWKMKTELIGDEYTKKKYESKLSLTLNWEKIRARINRDRFAPENVQEDDKDMGLSHYANKYGNFLDELHDDMVKREQKEKEEKLNRDKPGEVKEIIEPIPTQVPRPFTSPEFRRITAHCREGYTGTASPLWKVDVSKVIERKPKAEEKPEPKNLDEFFAQDDDDLEISMLMLSHIQINDAVIKDAQRKKQEEKRRKEEEALLAEERRLEALIREREEEERLKREAEEKAQRERKAEEAAARSGLRPPARQLITPLSEEWRSRVEAARNANPATELAKTLEGQPLVRRDFEEKLLPATAWLNDNVIIGAIFYIADYVNTKKGAPNQEPKCTAFTSFFWPRLLSHGPGGCGRLLRRANVRKANFLDIDTILIPICESSHWTLAVIRPGRRTVSHLDSMAAGRGSERVKAKLLELVKFVLEDQFVEAEWQAVDFQAPRQTNGWDCGVFTITNAICLALGVDPAQAYTEAQLPLQRQRIAAVLLNGGFKGDFTLDDL
ncbi:specific protease-like protein [Thermochaetoides thermophila DSM 1495]|uniref:Specific protease-like protein n=1 Tax=Chaetomium thermophilum (strain DSM 1495 / CBS 144.50 / IMI 039719) TaxID=759272 RepID=G0RZV7_CHATD|nr:specific protease-like protein [Thermochaetoides thermophila DSM 1495]EGS23735.1 specific protease-like protein [Thermochaetoides thermophila DSM 1495]